MNFVLQISAAAALAFGSSMAAAQTGQRPDPTQPAIKVPPAVYESAFTTYRRYEEAETLPWQAVNDEAGRLRGHRGQVEPAAPTEKPSGHPALPPAAAHGHDH